MTLVRVTTIALAYLAILLPLLGLVTAQFSLGCESSSCGWWDVVAAATVPIVLLWLVVVGELVRRTCKRIVDRVR